MVLFLLKGLGTSAFHGHYFAFAPETICTRKSTTNWAKWLCNTRGKPEIMLLFSSNLGKMTLTLTDGLRPLERSVAPGGVFHLRRLFCQRDAGEPRWHHRSWKILALTSLLSLLSSGAAGVTADSGASLRAGDVNGSVGVSHPAPSAWYKPGPGPTHPLVSPLFRPGFSGRTFLWVCLFLTKTCHV